MRTFLIPVRVWNVDSRVFRGCNELRNIDEALRSYLLDLCGTAASSGFGPALLDVADIEHASADELLRIAERMGIDIGMFEEGDAWRTSIPTTW